MPTPAEREQSRQEAADRLVRFCYGVHVDGGQTFTDQERDEVKDLGRAVTELPTFAGLHQASALQCAAMLKHADPDALVTLVLWPDENEDYVIRTAEQVALALDDVRAVAEVMRRRRAADLGEQTEAGA